MALLALTLVALAQATPLEVRPDARERAQAKVEALYGAGDLPGALREALRGLRETGEDAALLRRATQLAASLRMADVAEDHARRLERAIESQADLEQRDAWRRDANLLAREAALLSQRERELESAERRARVVSLGVLCALAGALVLLGRMR